LGPLTATFEALIVLATVLYLTVIEWLCNFSSFLSVFKHYGDGSVILVLHRRGWLWSELTSYWAQNSVWAIELDYSLGLRSKGLVVEGRGNEIFRGRVAPLKA
jgi:hypothetical protein